MTITELIIGEFKQENETTTKLLQLVPMDNADWKPHEKSMSIGSLAKHVAQISGWIPIIVLQNEFDFTNRPFPPTTATTTDELLPYFKQITSDGLEILNNTTDDALSQPWTFKKGDHIFFTMPKAVCLRNFVFNHIVHHRAQLGVYLRLLNIPIPGSYGPSADDATKA